MPVCRNPQQLQSRKDFLSQAFFPKWALLKSFVHSLNEIKGHRCYASMSGWAFREGPTQPQGPVTRYDEHLQTTEGWHV